MKKSIIICILIIIILTLITSLLGTLTYSDNNYIPRETLRHQNVEIQMDGLYKFNIKSLIAEGIAWDFVRLIIAVPALIIGFILFLKESLRGTLFLIGVLAAIFYQYFLWAFGWAYNPLFLCYVIIYSLSLCTIILILASLKKERLKTAFSDSFPVKYIGIFNISVAGILMLMWLKEILPTLYPNTIPEQFAGVHTLFVQAADLGIVIPFAIFSGILLLKRNLYGYLLASVAIIFMIFMGLAIIAGVILNALKTGYFDPAGLIIFTVVTVIAVSFLITFLKHIQVNKYRMTD